MNAAQKLHKLGQSLWLDNITRALPTSSTLSRYIREFAVKGLTSNPTIYDALSNGSPDSRLCVLAFCTPTYGLARVKAENPGKTEYHSTRQYESSIRCQPIHN